MNGQNTLRTTLDDDFRLVLSCAEAHIRRLVPEDREGKAALARVRTALATSATDEGPDPWFVEAKYSATDEGPVVEPDNDLARAFEAARMAARPAVPALDEERLAEAITMHSVAQRAGGPDAYFNHKCMGDCATDIAVKYAALRSKEPTDD